MDEYLKVRGVPETYLSINPSDLPEELEEKYLAWTKIVSRQFPVTIVTGTNNTSKMKLITCLLKAFIPLRKSVYMFYPGAVVEDIPGSFLYAVIGIDVVPEVITTFLKNKLYQHIVLNNCPVILECESMKSLENAMGKNFMDAISEKVIQIDTGITRVKNTVL